MKTKWCAAGVVLALAAVLIGAPASWAKPGDLPSPNDIECQDGDGAKKTLEIELGLGTNGFTFRWGTRPAPEMTPNLDAFLPAFLDQFVVHLADLLARPDRIIGIDALLGKMARVHTAAFGPAQANPADAKLHKTREAEAMQKARATVEMRLFETVNLNLKNVPLQQAIKTLAQTSGLRITPDFAALDDARVNLNQPVNVAANNCTVHAALRQVVEQAHLTFETRNGVVLVTVPQRNVGQSNAERRAQADAKEAQRIFEIAERQRRAGQNDMARKLFQQVHLLAPTTLHGRMAIVRIIEIEERMRDVSEEQGNDGPGRSDDSDQVFRNMRERTIPLGLVNVSY
jgi:hypothetical protein